jgi:hypothetical protein
LPKNPAIDADERDLLRGRYFESNCIGTDLVGDFVYISGAAVGGLYTATRCDPLNPSTMPAVGVIVSKSSTVRCFVQALGELGTGGGMTPGGRFWIGLDGQLDSSPPVPGAGELVVAQVVGVALDADTLLLRPDLSPVILRG